MATSWSMKKETLVLTALSRGPKHGYEVVKFIEGSTNGFFKMSFGSLYPILHRFENDGWVEAEWVASESGKDKKVYRLTKLGRKRLEQEKVSLTGYISALTQLADL